MRDVKPEPIPEEALKILEQEKKTDQKPSKFFYLSSFVVGILLYLIIRNFA
ncbi:hypothetical protein [Acinetobacter sp. YH16032]|uniref:hypothetical protein n=1 Tax=Acinetobacter sp. YH16032 TaxID=2601181 RepID=UPI0015D2A505|nr:hypothetical protein [Acinetobacter sp. YH16032]